MEISNNQPKKIAYVITLPDLGGAQSHLYEIMRNIPKYGYEPVLITGKEGWLTDKAKAEGIPCHIVQNLVRPISPIKDFLAVREVKKILRQEQPALVHCHSSKAGIIGRIAAHGCKIPAIFTAHGWAFTEGVHPLKRRIYACIENMAGYWTKKIICVSEYDRNLGAQYLPKHKDKMVTIHNGIPDMPELVRDWEKHPVGDVLNIIVVARFAPPKRNIEILHHLRNMLDSGLKITITFVGDGPQLDMAKAESKRLHLEKNAIFLGARTDVAELLPKYDMFLLLSNWEGFPISILEAMRASLPVLASDVGGVSEAVQDKLNGWLIGKAEEEILDSCLLSAKDNKNIINQLGQNSRRIYKEKYTIKRMLEQICTVYQEIE